MVAPHRWIFEGAKNDDKHEIFGFDTPYSLVTRWGITLYVLLGIFVTHIHVPLCGSSGSFQIGFLSIYKVCSVFSGISLSTSFQSVTWLSFICNEIVICIRIGNVNNLPTMPLFTGISRNSQSKSYMLSLTECVRDFQRNAWDRLSVCPRIWQAYRTTFLSEYSSYILEVPNDAFQH